MDYFLRNGEKVIEVTVVIDLQIAIVALDEEGILKLELLGAIVWVCDLFALFKEDDIAAVVQEDLSIVDLVVVYFEQ